MTGFGLQARKAMSGFVVLAAEFVLLSAVLGCVAVGYSTGSGWFVWPGGLGLLLIVPAVVFLLRRSRR